MANSGEHLILKTCAAWRRSQ